MLGSFDVISFQAIRVKADKLTTSLEIEKRLGTVSKSLQSCPLASNMAGEGRRMTARRVMDLGKKVTENTIRIIEHSIIEKIAEGSDMLKQECKFLECSSLDKSESSVNSSRSDMREQREAASRNNEPLTETDLDDDDLIIPLRKYERSSISSLNKIETPPRQRPMLRKNSLAEFSRLGNLDPKCYKVMDKTLESKGRIEFSLRYSSINQTLSVMINKAEIYGDSLKSERLSMEKNKRRSSVIATLMTKRPASTGPKTCFLEIQLSLKLLPLEKKKSEHQSKHHFDTYTPVFDDLFEYYQLPVTELRQQTLEITLECTETPALPPGATYSDPMKHFLTVSVPLISLKLAKDLPISRIDFSKGLVSKRKNSY